MSSNPVPTVKFTIDGLEVEVPKGTKIVDAAKKVGKYIPHFCYHQGLSIAGQCRMCYVEIEGMPKLATACSTDATDNMKVLTEEKSEKVKVSQKNTLEFTLLHHPLDCPICDRGGECKLQDYTLEYGPSHSRMIDEKKHGKKHTDISDQIVLDQERCILCTRCVRFSAEVDGRQELVVIGRGSDNRLDVFEGRPMQSKFSGNVVDLCPVGALTANDFRFKARPWELKDHEAICTGCSVGCNIIINTKHRSPGISRPDGTSPSPKVLRLMPRENMDINTWWMCDKGRWGYHFTNNDEARIQRPQIKKKDVWEDSSLSDIQKHIDTQKNWHFILSDDCPHEIIEWAQQTRKSWLERGRKVDDINGGKLAELFNKYWSSRAHGPWRINKPQWNTIKHVVCTMGYRDLEDVTPILALRLGQALRQGRIQWHERPMDKFAQDDDINSTAYLLPVPKSENDLNLLERIPVEAKTLMLFTRVNSRGLADSGIAPLEVIEHDLSQQNPQAVFYFSQTTQNPTPQGVLQFMKKAKYAIIADSFRNEVHTGANVLLPLTPLYESEATFTSLEGFRQLSKGIHLHHPNTPSIERGGTVVSPALKVL